MNVEQLDPNEGGASRLAAAVLVTAAVLWTLVCAAAVVLTLQNSPVVLELEDGPLFLSGVGDLVAVWAIVLVPLATPLLASARGRRTILVLWSVGILAMAGWAWMELTPDRPGIDSSVSSDEIAGKERTTLLVAVDGMSWTAALPMVRKGEMPNLARLMEEGDFGVLHSLRTYRKKVDKWGYWSPVVWTSMATGVRPQRHGITDFTLPKSPGHGAVAASTHRQAAAFWNLFSAFDRRVGVVGWWASWPAEQVSGYMASSHLGLRGHRGREPASSGLTHPPELVEELPGVGTSPRDLEDWVEKEIFPFSRYPVLDPGSLETMYRVLWQDRLYLDITKYLAERERLDLYAVYFEGIDALSHHFWRGMIEPEEDFLPLLPQGFREHERIVPNYYRILDSYLGELLDRLPEETTVLIVSDHGFQLDDDHPKGADHSPYGVIVARGPGIRRGESLNLDPLGSLREMLHDETDVLDVLPTLLYLHGLPVADDLPGEVLGDMLTGDLLERQPLLTVDSYGDFSASREVQVVVDPAASKEYEERLRALGYID